MWRTAFVLAAALVGVIPDAARAAPSLADCEAAFAAAPLFRQAAEGYHARDLGAGEVYARINLSESLSALGASGDRVQEQLDLARSAARMAAEATDDPIPDAEVTVKEAKLLLLRGGAVDLAEGRAHLSTALDMARRARDPEVLAGVLSASAMDLLADDPEEARRRVDEAYTLLLSTDDPWAQAYGWAEVYSVWTEMYQWLVGQLLTDAESTDPGAPMAEQAADGGAATGGNRSWTAGARPADCSWGPTPPSARSRRGQGGGCGCSISAPMPCSTKDIPGARR